MRAIIAAIALLSLGCPAPAAAAAAEVYQTCGMDQALVDEIAAKIGARRLADPVATGFLAVFNRAEPKTRYTGPVLFKDWPKDDALEFIVRDGATFCLFGVAGPLRAAVLHRFEGDPT